MRGRASVVGLAVALAVAAACTSGTGHPNTVAPTGGRLTGVVPLRAASPTKLASACAGPAVSSQPGAPASLGLTRGDATMPVWSAGPDVAVLAAGDGLALAQAFGSSSAGSCLIGLSPDTGATLWSWPSGHPRLVMNAELSTRLALVATGDFHDNGNAMSYAATNRLTGLDPQTGAQLWTLSLADDGQGVPAGVDGTVVVVAEQDGTVVGLDAHTGHLLWMQRRPVDCAVTGTSDLTPAAVLLSATPPTVLYPCTAQQQVARLDPTTGRSVWTSRLPAGWTLDGTSAAVATGVIAVVGSGPGETTARHRNASGAPPGYETVALLGLQVDTGRVTWQVDGLTQGSAVTTAGNLLAVVDSFAVTALRPADAAQVWRWQPVVPATPDSNTAMRVAISGAQLYAIDDTAAASAIPRESTTYRSAPGTFQLDTLDVTSGRVLSTRPLPAYYGGDQGVVVSPSAPPSVAGVSGTDVFVNPGGGADGVVETFTTA